MAKSTTITVTEAARKFSAYIGRVAFRGERFVLTRGRKPVAVLEPVSGGRRLAELPGLLDSLPRLGSEEAEAFGRDVDEARAEIAGGLPEDRWGS